MVCGLARAGYPLRRAGRFTSARRSPSALDLTPPGGTSSGRRDHRVCLGIDKLPKTPPNDVESKRGEDLDKKTTLLPTYRAKSKGTEDILIWLDCWCFNLLYPSTV